MVWKNAKTNEPNFDGVHYLVIIKIGNEYVYSFALWDKEGWIDNKEKKVEVIAFTETDPKFIIETLQLWQ